jgi:hypothetical protein
MNILKNFFSIKEQNKHQEDGDIIEKNNKNAEKNNFSNNEKQSNQRERERERIAE